MPERPHILVVDDDAALRRLLQRYLTEQGFEVTTLADGRGLDRHLAETPPDLVVMDIMLPGEDGLTLTRRLRERGNLPVLVLSARGDEVDRILGLELGADDYLPKPFNPRELAARIRAVLRRHRSGTRADAEEVVAFGPYRLNLTRGVLWRDGREVPLTSGERSLLELLARHPNRVLSRDWLVEQLKGYDRSPFDRSIDVRIARLRQKIEPAPGRPKYIRTVWGRGYRFTPEGDTA